MYKHTPGPWYVINGWDNDGNGKHFPKIVFTDVSEGKNPIEFGGTLHVKGIIVNASHDQDAKSIMANAKLIAAAPELLDACSRATDYLSWKYPKESDILNELKQAIEKATL